MWDTKRPHFLMGFKPSLCSERLNIPCNFVKHMEGRTQGTLLLVGPSGNHWYAELVLVENDLFLTDGWPDFVRDHFLEESDALVFRYDGDLRFSVQVFDRGMCEKEKTFTAESSQDLGKYGMDLMRKRDREGSALLDGVFEGVPKRMRCESTDCDEQERMTQAKDMINLENDVIVALPLMAVQLQHEDPGSAVRSRATNLDMLLSASEADRVAQSFESSLPRFSKVMKKFNISGSYTLNLPYQFATEHLPKHKVKIVLHNLNGESWTVNSIPTIRVQTSHTFCGGWLSFVRDNCIGFGDTCIFELVRKFEFQVRIHKVKKDGINSESANGGKNSGCSTKSPTKVSRHKLKKKNVNVVKDSAISSQSNNSIAESEVPKRYDSLDKPVSQTKGCVSMKSAPEEKMAAEHFVSSFPHFVRVMKKFNVSGSFTLNVPYQFSTDHMPHHKTEIILHNLNGKSWTVNSVPTIKVQTLHTFCGGWMAFVRDNNIQMGDICIFELVGNCEMRVHVCGIGKKGLSCPNGTNCHPTP